MEGNTLPSYPFYEPVYKAVGLVSCEKELDLSTAPENEEINDDCLWTKLTLHPRNNKKIIIITIIIIISYTSCHLPNL